MCGFIKEDRIRQDRIRTQAEVIGEILASNTQAAISDGAYVYVLYERTVDYHRSSFYVGMSTTPGTQRLDESKIERNLPHGFKLMEGLSKNQALKLEQMIYDEMKSQGYILKNKERPDGPVGTFGIYAMEIIFEHAKGKLPPNW